MNMRETRRCEVCGGTATIRESSFLDPPGVERWYCAIHADPMHPERVSQPQPEPQGEGPNQENPS